MPGNEEPTAEPLDTLTPAATLEFLGNADRSGALCALLTPAIKARMKDLEPGQVLLVRADDPSARLDVQAWCALTGNVVQATRVEDNGVIDLFIRKESRR